ncbi:unnamed protein product [Rhizoctonia solani]|uniref:Vegetative incompatibility protein HET-E-1 [Podospora anserina] n=1 Tax=Rhizoctonia solani TaxID=456999 RepID=A0A8H3HR45_9AGAM|nr:unnamed protein product [Rhizoctonia solani]
MRLGPNIVQEARNWCDKRSLTDDVARIAQDAWEFVSLHSMSLSVDGARAVVTDGVVPIVVDTSTGDRILTVDEAHTDLVGQAAISPDGTRIAFRGWHDTIYILDIITETITDLLVRGVLPMSPVVFSRDGSWLAFGSTNNAYIYHSQLGELVVGPLVGHAGIVRSVAISPTNSYLASGSYNGDIRVWDVNSGYTVGTLLQGHEGEIVSVNYSPDGIYLASGSIDGTIRLWDPKRDKQCWDR